MTILARETEPGVRALPHLAKTVLRPSTGWRPIDFKELWHYRELLWFLAKRDIQVKYKQTVMGVAWAVIQPVMQTVVFTIFLGKLGKMEQGSIIPYSMLTMCAQLPWILFQNAMTQSGNSLVANERLITKVYFPRLIIPMAAVLSGVVDFLIALALFLAVLPFFKTSGPDAHSLIHNISWGIIALPFFLLMTLLAATAVGLWLSGLNVKYRDVRYVIPFLAQMWMFASPVVYLSSILHKAEKLPDYLRPLVPLYYLNPMAGVIDGFRWALLGTEPPGMGLVLSCASTVVLLIGGLYYFKRIEKSFADLV